MGQQTVVFSFDSPLSKDCSCGGFVPLVGSASAGMGERSILIRTGFKNKLGPFSALGKKRLVSQEKASLLGVL